ncbi:hypothetical protein REPUB_Repub02eG0017000 [Reevesia pubescens]
MTIEVQKMRNMGLNIRQKFSVSFNSNSKPGWPLLRITASITSDSFSEPESIKPPMVERVMPVLRKMPTDLELRCKKFSLRELKQATSGYCPGTFGYIAPEYFMEGRVSDKIDVYSFGVMLLELLSGSRPISSKAVEGQESLIQWARALLQRGNPHGLVDPALDVDFDVAQMHRMVLAASLCLNKLARYRPTMSQEDILTSVSKPSQSWTIGI